MTDHALIRQHRIAQIHNGGLAAMLVLELGKDFLAGNLSRDDFTASLIGADKLSHDAAVRLAAKFVTEFRDSEGVDGEIVEPVFDTGASFGRAIGTLTDIDTARSGALTERDWDREYWRIVEQLAVRADRAAKMAGRHLVMDSAEASGRRWRRVSDGNPCSFCAMLVARGPAYRSEDSALRVVGRTGRGAGKGHSTRGVQRLGDKFHNHCGCTVVEQIGPWNPTAEERRYVDAYDAAAQAADDAGLPHTADTASEGRTRRV